MAIRIQQRNDTTINWTTYNPVLAVGEIGLDTDQMKTKIGDGVSTWNELQFLEGVTGATGATGDVDYSRVVNKDGDGMTGALAVGTTATDASAQLAVSSTTKGFLPPRMNTAQRGAIVNPTEGLMIYNTDTYSVEVYNGFGWNTPGSDIIWDGGSSVVSASDKIVDGGYA